MSSCELAIEAHDQFFDDDHRDDDDDQPDDPVEDALEANVVAEREVKASRITNLDPNRTSQATKNFRLFHAAPACP